MRARYSESAERRARRAARRSSSSPIRTTARSGWSRRRISPPTRSRTRWKSICGPGKSGIEETPEGKVFLTVHVPSPKLVITGAVHISQALAPMGQLLGYDVTIVDPRTAFASVERFPDVKVIAEWPDVALPPLGIDHYTAFVALTHDPKIDDPASLHAFEKRLLLYRRAGSRKTHARRVKRLKRRRAFPITTSAASIRRSGSISARFHRPKSLSLSWARSPRGCGETENAAA